MEQLELFKVYDFKKEFCNMLQIPMNQAERRLDELLSWLNEFFDYEFYKGRPNRIKVTAIYGDYQPMPRKLPKQDKLNQEKTEDYTNFSIAALGNEFKPNSRTRVARQAICSFGRVKYGHTSPRSVANKYIKPVFDKYGETNNKYHWVYYGDYSLLEPEKLKEWKDILRVCKIDEEAAANAFYRYAEGEDISEEINYFKKAREMFLEKYGDFPVRVPEWRLKNIL